MQAHWSCAAALRLRMYCFPRSFIDYIWILDSVVSKQLPSVVVLHINSSLGSVLTSSIRISQYNGIIFDYIGQPATADIRKSVGKHQEEGGIFMAAGNDIYIPKSKWHVRLTEVRRQQRRSNKMLVDSFWLAEISAMSKSLAFSIWWHLLWVVSLCGLSMALLVVGIFSSCRSISFRH